MAIGLLRAFDGDDCSICGQFVGDADSDIDHIVQRAVGGTDEVLNLRLTHKRCNRARPKPRKGQGEDILGSNHTWIHKAIHHVGGLHKSLGVPQGRKIPHDQLKAAARKGGLIGRQARLALTLEGMPHPEPKAAPAAEAPVAPAVAAPERPKPTVTTHGGGLHIASL